eukprot:scaffold381_cov178-Amphora_coffeaeformis.AAC.18
MPPTRVSAEGSFRLDLHRVPRNGPPSTRPHCEPGETRDTVQSLCYSADALRHWAVFEGARLRATPMPHRRIQSSSVAYYRVDRENLRTNEVLGAIDEQRARSLRGSHDAKRIAIGNLVR